ncbi:MAG: hypothetical protein ABR562_07750 [Thermoplasmatota archaeon]
MVAAVPGDNAAWAAQHLDTVRLTVEDNARAAPKEIAVGADGCAAAALHGPGPWSVRASLTMPLGKHAGFTWENTTLVEDAQGRVEREIRLDHGYDWHGDPGYEAIPLNLTFDSLNRSAPYTTNGRLDGWGWNSFFEHAMGPNATWKVWIVPLARTSPVHWQDPPAASGEHLPADFALAFPTPGSFRIVARALDGFGSGEASVLASAYGPGFRPAGRPSIFQDGAENGDEGWTFEATVAAGGLGAPYPLDDKGWRVSDQEADNGTHSWWTGNDAAWRGNMTSPPFKLPNDDLVHGVWFTTKGWPDNEHRLLLSLVGTDRPVSVWSLALGMDVWAPEFADLTSFAGQNVQLRFTFEADSLCGTNVCDSAGFFLDGIAVF